MSSASLSLLKGANKAPVEEETPVETAAEGGEEEQVTVDPDTMTAKEIDALVASYGIEVPENWPKMKLAQKRTTLKEMFASGDDEGEGEAETAAETVAEEPAPEPTPAPKATGKKATPAKAAVEDAEVEQVEAAPAKATGKAVATSKAKTGTVETTGDDMLADIIHEIESLTEKDARALIGQLAEQSEVTFFRLGGILSVIQANSWYAPFTSFREFVENEYGLEYRKATYWVSIYNSLAESKIPWTKVKSIPWTKLKEIAKIITLENVDEWVKIAKKNNTLTLIELVKNFNKKQKSISGEPSSPVTVKTFKVNDEQKNTIEEALAKAKSESGTEYDTVALELLCMEYLGSQTVTQRLAEMGVEKAAEMFEAAFPNATLAITIDE